MFWSHLTFLHYMKRATSHTIYTPAPSFKYTFFIVLSSFLCLISECCSDRGCRFCPFFALINLAGSEDSESIALTSEDENEAVEILLKRTRKNASMKELLNCQQ